MIRADELLHSIFKYLHYLLYDSLYRINCLHINKTKSISRLYAFSFHPLRAISIILISICLQTNILAQAKNSTIYQSDFTLPTDAIYFTVDQLQQLYTISPTNEFSKYSADGVLQFTYNNNTLGTLTQVDVTNPFSILLFYGDFRTLITLDRNLTETNVFDLYSLDVNEIRAIAQSSDNNLWLYDDVRFKLKKINRQGKVLIESDDLSLLLGRGLFPNLIIEKDNRVYVNDPSTGILVFDIFGQYIKTLERKELERFQIYNQQLLYQKDTQLHAFHLQSLLETTIQLPKEINNNAQVILKKGKLFWLEQGQLEVFKY